MTLTDFGFRLEEHRTVIAYIRGEVSFSSAPELEESLAAAVNRAVQGRDGQQSGRMVLDLSGATSLNHHGTEVIEATRRLAEEMGCRLVLVASSPDVHKSLKSSGLLARTLTAASEADAFDLLDFVERLARRLVSYCLV